jgi:tRNA (guanine-N7-)-methyltransferase
VNSTAGTRPLTSDYKVNEPPVDFAEIFGNRNPVEFEIGCGKGKFLLEAAEANLDRNYFGIDYAGKWMKVGETRSGKRNLQNIRFLKTEARRFLQRMPAGSVSVFHIYFPDPWHKRRHRVRRTVTTDFLMVLHARLTRGGIIEMATDDEDYFLQMKKAAAATAVLWKESRESLNQRFSGSKTNYEIKFEAEGRLLYYLELRK